MDYYEQISVKIHEFIDFKKCIWKRRLQNSCHFVQGPVCDRPLQFTIPSVYWAHKDSMWLPDQFYNLQPLMAVFAFPQIIYVVVVH